MQRLAVLIFSLAIVGLIGCGDTGGKKDDNTKRSETFTFKGPMTGSTIKQGDKKTVDLTVDRGKEFKQDVALSVDSPPKGISVDLDPKEVKAGDPEKVTATVSVDKDAPVGDHEVTITAKPKEGKSATYKLKVTVEGKKD